MSGKYAPYSVASPPSGVRVSRNRTPTGEPPVPRILLTKSDNPKKKWMVILPDGKKVRFGATGYDDFTQANKDEERYLEKKKRYLERHKKREDWNDWETAGFYSRWLLWNKPSLRDSIKDTNKRFNIHIIKVRKVDDE